jgi:glycine hydroxymethyltransferase
LERAHITTNKNGIPFDPQSPFITSGIRVGTPAGTTRGFGKDEFAQIGRMIGEVVTALSQNAEGDAAVEKRVADEVIALCARFPIYAAGA